jgi:hypothetical protein
MFALFHRNHITSFYFNDKAVDTKSIKIFKRWFSFSVLVSTITSKLERGVKCFENYPYGDITLKRENVCLLIYSQVHVL